MSYERQRVPALLRYILAGLLLGVAGVMDFLTGPEISVQLLYLLPIGLLAWFDSLPAAAGLGIVSVGLVLYIGLNEHDGHSGSPVAYWNALVAAATFFSFAVLTSALSMTQGRLRDLARLDPLTGLSNRRSFMERAAAELSRARRSGRSFSLLYVDLDNFKRVNDALGHSAGDSLLRTISGELCSCTRETDIVARLGGDEFVVLLPQTGKDQALVVAKRLRDGLRASSFCGEEGLNLNVRASIGLATYPHDARTAHDVIRQADGMMYVVKNSSRDNIGIAQRGTLKE
jgi:diguanylate cyclase (GGDEF)-like protein